MLRLATLGLLQQEPLNGYRLMQQLETYMGWAISVNSGAIYPLLKRMEEKGEICLKQDNPLESGQGSKIYQITPAGQKCWHQEMLSHPQESWVNARSRFYVKFFFFTHLNSAERLQLIEHRLMSCQLRMANRKVQELPEDFYQQLVWERSLEILESEIQWLIQQRDQERSHALHSSCVLPDPA